MYQLLAETQVNPIEWNDNVKRLNGCAFHSYEWSLFSSEKNNEMPIYFRLYDDSKITHSVAIGFMKTKRLAGKPIFKTLSFGSFPACNDHNFLQIMIKEIIKYCHRNRIISCGMHSFGTPSGTGILDAMGFSTEKRWEFLLNMPTSEEELWNRIHSKKRNLIRKAQKEKIRVEQVTEIDEVMELRKLAFETQKRKEDDGIPFPVADESHYRLLKNRLIDSGLGRLYLAYEENEAVAGAFFVGYNKSAYYMLSSAKEKGLQKAAPDLILWTSMKDYQQGGYKVFNFGGLSERELNGEPLEKSGLFHFKKRFSSNEYLCYKGTLILKPVTFKVYEFLRKTKSRLFA